LRGQDGVDDLEWTIVYASMLSDSPASGSVVVLPDGSKRGLSQKVLRADVAAWMIEAATSDHQSRRSVGITG
jgi:NAD(P)H-binding